MPSSPPRQHKFRAMTEAHLASQIWGELGYAHRPQLGTQFWGPLGQEDVCPNFALTVVKIVFNNLGNFRAKTNPLKPRSCPKRPFLKSLGPDSSSDCAGTFE